TAPGAGGTPAPSSRRSAPARGRCAGSPDRTRPGSATASPCTIAMPDLPVLIVGDVHGDLERLFSGLKPYPPDRWRTIFLGDLVDGGPFGVGALRYARDRPNSTVLLGNHEVMMLGALPDRAQRGDGFRSWLGAGGQPHDLEELAKDEPLQEWLRRREAAVILGDGTLAQHCDSDE